MNIKPIKLVRSWISRHPLTVSALGLSIPAFFAGLLLGLFPYLVCQYSLAQASDVVIGYSRQTNTTKCHHHPKRITHDFNAVKQNPIVSGDFSSRWIEPRYWMNIIKKQNSDYENNKHNHFQHVVPHSQNTNANTWSRYADGDKNSNIKTKKGKQAIKSFHVSSFVEGLTGQSFDHKAEDETPFIREGA